MDDRDRSILRHLQEDGRISNIHLSKRIHMSPPQTLIRVRKLENSCIIRGYVAQVSAQAIGLGVTAFVNLSLDKEKCHNVREVESNIAAFPNIIECHSVAGNYDYILKVVASDLKSLSQFLNDRLMHAPGVASLRSTVCMEEIKPMMGLPIV